VSTLGRWMCLLKMTPFRGRAAAAWPLVVVVVMVAGWLRPVVVNDNPPLRHLGANLAAVEFVLACDSLVSRDPQAGVHGASPPRAHGHGLVEREQGGVGCVGHHVRNCRFVERQAHRHWVLGRDLDGRGGVIKHWAGGIVAGGAVGEFHPKGDGRCLRRAEIEHLHLDVVVVGQCNGDAGLDSRAGGLPFRARPPRRWPRLRTGRARLGQRSRRLALDEVAWHGLDVGRKPVGDAEGAIRV
jgi:hypothetical protein